MNSSTQGPDFQTLVQTLKGDRSYEAISKLAGGKPNAKSLQKLIQHGFTRFPDQETFEGLSIALNVRKRDLVLAAARTIGIDVSDDDQRDLVLIGAKRLPQDSQDLLTAMSREMQAWMDGKNRAVEPERANHKSSFPDNVRHLPTPDWTSHAADSEAGKTSGQDIDPDQLPDE